MSKSCPHQSTTDSHSFFPMPWTCPAIHPHGSVTPALPKGFPVWAICLHQSHCSLRLPSHLSQTHHPPSLLYPMRGAEQKMQDQFLHAPSCRCHFLSFRGSLGVGMDSGATVSLWGKKCWGPGTIHTSRAQWATRGIAGWGHLLRGRVTLTELAVQQGEPGGLEEDDMMKQLKTFSPWISLLRKKMWRNTADKGWWLLHCPLIGKGLPLAS